LKFTRDLTHTGTLHKKGSPYEGGIGFARFLFHRGNHEPSGAAIDEHVTAKKPNKPAWHSGTEAQDTPKKGKKE
jgi:hypothetical protein